MTKEHGIYRCEKHNKCLLNCKDKCKICTIETCNVQCHCEDKKPKVPLREFDNFNKKEEEVSYG